MRVFVTGASGHIGSLVVPELLAAGHQVVGLARSDASAAKLEAAGAEPHPGDLEDLSSLRQGALASDGVIHLAFGHDFSDYGRAGEVDLRAIQALGEALEGTSKPLVVTSGTAVGGTRPGIPLTEEDAGDPDGPGGPRVRSEHVAIALAERGVRSSVVRLPPTVHGPTDLHGFVPQLIGIARSRGVSGYVGDGSNRWPAVHNVDAATLFRLALEDAPPGSRLHAVGDEGVPFREIAEAIARNLGLPTASVGPEGAVEHFGWLGDLVSLDIPASGEATQRRFGWKPEHLGLIADLDEGHYFTS
jgi:nucleoside-diphosphate-sugar epimerase